jgi:hypothetical protein
VLQITQLQLTDIDNLPLRHLSTADHDYFEGQTLVHGTITVEGDANDELAELVLEVVQSRTVVARGQLFRCAERILLQAFPSPRIPRAWRSRRAGCYL